MEKNVKNRTMSVVREELDASVDKYNLATDAAVRNQLALEHKTLVEEFNQLSLLSAYATFMQAELPIVALAKAYYYTALSVKDNAHNEVINGVVKSTVTRSVKEVDKKLDLVKFIDWTEERNKSVAFAKDWRTKIGVARSSIENEWKKFFASKAEKKDISIGKVKKATQEAFDALVFIPCENNKDKNAIIADGDIAKALIAFANSRKDARVDGKVAITGNILPRATWNVLLLDALHSAVEGKKYTLVFGDGEDETADADEKAEA